MFTTKDEAAAVNTLLNWLFGRHLAPGMGAPAADAARDAAVLLAESADRKYGGAGITGGEVRRCWEHLRLADSVEPGVPLLAERDQLRARLDEAALKRDAYAAAMHELFGGVAAARNAIKRMNSGKPVDWALVEDILVGKVRYADERLGTRLEREAVEAERDRLRALVERLPDLVEHDLDSSACRARPAHQETLRPCQQRPAEHSGDCPACEVLAALQPETETPDA